MAEELEKEGLVVDHDTLRRWLLATGRRTVRRRRQQHRQWRERKPCFGAMVQLDGSHHDWFEGRRGKCVLMVMVDDATNRIRVRFFEEETTRASYDLLEVWVRQHGLPGALYVGPRQHLPLRRPGQRGGPTGGQGTADPIWACDGATGGGVDFGQQPQAKGRVERMNGVLQDRLVKALRLAKIDDLEGANAFLEQTYEAEFNRRFARVPASRLDAHRGVPETSTKCLVGKSNGWCNGTGRWRVKASGINWIGNMKR